MGCKPIQDCRTGKEIDQFLNGQPKAKKLRQKGSHQIWNVNGTLVVNPVHPGDQGKGLNRAIIKAIVTALGLATVFFIFILPNVI